MKPSLRFLFLVLSCALLLPAQGCGSLPLELERELREVPLPEILAPPTPTPRRPVRKGLALGLYDCADPALVDSHGIFIAQHFDQVITSGSSGLAGLKEINPGMQVYTYWHARFTAEASLGEELYLYDTYRGTRLVRREEGAPEFLLDTGSQAWREYSLAQIEARLETGFDGVLLDGIRSGLDFRILQDENGIPLQDTYGPVPGWYDDSEYRRGMAGYIEFLKGELGEQTVLLNGISRSGAELEFLPAADGALTESFVYDQEAYGYLSGDSWREVMGSLLAAPQNGQYGVVVHGAVEDHQARLYALASYYLGVGEGTFYAYTPSCRTLTYLPEYAVDLGAPLETYAGLEDYYRKGVYLYMREFEKGRVYVNHGGAPRPLDFEQPMYLLVLERGLTPELGGSGDLYYEVVESLVVPPQHGVILLKQLP